MLTKIYCEKFKSKDGPRGIIHFHPGLNTVLGGLSAENSIGKSTFLLAIDFAFGGKTFVDSEAAKEIGNHTIGFTFEFDGVEYHFCRDVANHTTIHKCDDDSYKPSEETLTLAQFCEFLKEKYAFDIPGLTFRDGVGRYMRIWGKKNVFDPSRPLSSTPSEKADKAIVAFEKLFEKYSQIESYRTEEEKAKKDNKILKEARNAGLLPSDITSEKKYRDNEKEIEKLEQEQADLIERQDIELTESQLAHTHQVEMIKKNIESLKQYYGRLKSEYNVIQLNIEGKAAPTEADIKELAAFFPGVDVKRISEIELQCEDVMWFAADRGIQRNGRQSS